MGSPHTIEGYIDDSKGTFAFIAQSVVTIVKIYPGIRHVSQEPLICINSFRIMTDQAKILDEIVGIAARSLVEVRKSSKKRRRLIYLPCLEQCLCVVGNTGEISLRFLHSNFEKGESSIAPPLSHVDIRKALLRMGTECEKPMERMIRSV